MSAFHSDLMGIPVIGEQSDIPAGSSWGSGYEQRDRTVDPTGETGYAAPFNLPLLSRAEIKERARDREQSGHRTFDTLAKLGIPPLHQARTSSCWGQSACDGFQVSRALSGKPHVPMSATSITTLVTGGRDVGGWPIKAIRKGHEIGWCPVSAWPANAINMRLDTPETRASRAPYKVEADWLDLPPNNWDAVFTCLVLGYPVTLCHMEWSHAVLAIDVMILQSGELAALCRNSGYGRDRTGHSIVKESFGLPDDALAILSTT